MFDMKKKAEDILEDYANSYSQVDLETLAKFLNQIKSEAIKDFWKKLKEKKQWDIDISDYIFIADGDNLVKEMTDRSEEE